MELRQRLSWSTKCIFALTLGIVILSAVLERQFGTFDKKDIDFEVYFFTAQLIHDHPDADIYFSAFDSNPQLRNAPPDAPIYKKARQAGKSEVMLYLYPPLLADLVTPLAPYSEPSAVKIWRLYNLLLMFTAGVLIARVVNIPVLSSSFLVLATAFYCFFPVIECLGAGQVTILMFALWAVGVYAYDRNLYMVSALAMAAATVLKVTPLMILPLFIIWKEKRWLLAYGSAIGLLVFSMGMYNGWHTLGVASRVIAAMGGSIPTYNNKCISALLAWLYYGRVFGYANFPPLPAVLAITAKIVGLSFYGTCVYLAWRSRRVVGVQHRVSILAIFGIVSLLTSPVSWRHGYVMALIPLSLLWAQAQKESRPSLRTILLSVSSLSLGTLLCDLVAQTHGVAQPVRIAFASLSIVSCVLLCLDVLARGVERSNAELSVAA